MFENKEYNIFFEFIKNYSGSGFREINNKDHLMVRLNRVLESRRQFFYIGDIIKLDILYTSPQVIDLTGIEPENYDISSNFVYTHPFDIKRRSRIRANVIESGQELFISKTGNKIISSNFRIKKLGGDFSNILVQVFMFYSNLPVETVYILSVNTEIEWISKIIKKGHYHSYSGDDLSFFRYPDEELVLAGTNLSERELDVLRCVHKGMVSKDISDKLSLSIHTINTHRRNILKKSHKTSIGEVIFELEGIGMI